MTPRLTATQKKVLEFIHKYLTDNGMPPTRAEIRKHFGWSSDNTAECHIRALEKRGLLDTMPGTARGLRITPQGLALCGAGEASAMPNRPWASALVLPVVSMEKLNRSRDAVPRN